MRVQIRDATEDDLGSITSIYNHAVVHTTAIWNEATVDVANRAAWLDERHRLGYPVFVAEDHGLVVGYASFGDWRAWDGYRHTVEHSVYVQHDRRGMGVGKALMGELIERAQKIGKHVMIAGIDATNVASIGMHEKLGFTRAGLLEQVGAKFGSWLDLAFLQLILDPRNHPE